MHHRLKPLHAKEPVAFSVQLADGSRTLVVLPADKCGSPAVRVSEVLRQRKDAGSAQAECIISITRLR
jgi:hypothetical protein